MTKHTNILAILFIIAAHYTNAQSDYFWHRCDELNPVRSWGQGIHVDSSGFYLLYSDVTDTNSAYTKFGLAKYDLSANLLWENNFMASPKGSSALSNLIFTADSHFVFCGMTYDSTPKAFYAKTDYSGNLVFLKKHEGQYIYKLTKVIELSNGDLLFLGHTDSLVTASGAYNLFLIKTDSAGNEIWTKCIVLNTRIQARLDAIKRNDKIYITTSQSTTPTTSAHYYSKLICITEDGSLVLNKTYYIGSNGGGCPSITVSGHGTLLIGGASDEYFWPDDGTLFGEHSYGVAYFAEYDTLGNEIWSKKIGVPNFLNAVLSIKEVSDGYLLGGYTGWGYYYWPDSLYSYPSYSIHDLFLMKTDLNGDSIWMRLYRKQDGSYNYPNVWANQEIPEQMQISENGDIYYAGWFLPIMAIPGDYEQYAWVLKTDSNGCGKPGKPYGLWREELPYNADSSVVHLTWQDDDTTNIWHHVQGSKDSVWYFWELTPRMLTTNEFFDTVPKYHNYCYRVFGLDSTWARTCESAEICITTGIDEYAPESGLLALYPNPASDIINCVLPENEKFDIVVFDVSGKVVLHTDKSYSSTENIINIGALTPGIYFIEARGERVLRGKFVKE